MAKKLRPMTTISVRVSDTILADLHSRASQERQTVSGVIRLLIRDYLDEATGTDALGAMEARIVASIERAERQRARARWQAEITLAEVDYIRKVIDGRFLKRLEPNEDKVTVYVRGEKLFLDWLQKHHKRRSDILIKTITEPDITLEDQGDGTELGADIEPEGERPSPTPQT
jgi:hypothetical protein